MKTSIKVKIFFSKNWMSTDNNFVKRFLGVTEWFTENIVFVGNHGKKMLILSERL